MPITRGNPDYLSCSASNCNVLGEGGDEHKLPGKTVFWTYAFHSPGLTFSSRAILTNINTPYGFDCSTGADCEILGAKLHRMGRGDYRDEYEADVTINGGQDWTQYLHVPSFGRLSCPSETACVAGSAGDAGFPGRVLLYTADGGQHWADSKVGKDVPYDSVFGVACATPAQCVAVGGQPSRPTRQYGRLLLTSNDGGAHWRQATYSRRS